MTIGELLYNYRKQHNMTMQEFADKSGLSKGYISMLEKGRHPQSNRSLIPSVETVDKIASAMGISIDELLQMVDGDQLVSLKNSKKEHHPLPPNVIIPATHGIPILGTICCGNGIDDKSFQGYFFIDKSVKAQYCVQVRGDSMVEAHIYDGDYAFIKTDYEFQNGKIYAVVVDMPQGEAVLKKVFKADDHVILQPCNPKYDPIVCRPDDCYIVGELDGIYHKY